VREVSLPLDEQHVTRAKRRSLRVGNHLGHDVSALGVARYYKDWVDGFVLDAEDSGLARDIEGLGLKVRVADTMMRNDADKQRLAAEVLDFVDELAVSGRHS
jgi:LPPG:FO 2-phospho-L-lactate transferase